LGKTDDVRLSKLLSLWLRHQPEAVGLPLDAQGWTDVDTVLAALARNNIAPRSSGDGARRPRFPLTMRS
jgi:RNA:NAD 2'-phosphotransferase (TPT1/KptA family)